MKLDGIHHITCITADAPGNVDFYARVLGMRFMKKTVNFDAPDVYVAPVDGAIRFSDPEGLDLELAASDTGGEPLTARVVNPRAKRARS
jgi:catechol 2,3-dioxygenase-like lactoylglutathione lyase family enzyme